MIMTEYPCTILLKDGTSFKADLEIVHIENLEQVSIVEKVIREIPPITVWRKGSS